MKAADLSFPDYHFYHGLTYLKYYALWIKTGNPAHLEVMKNDIHYEPVRPAFLDAGTGNADGWNDRVLTCTYL